MKLVYLIVALLLPYSVYSQMKVNAGNDTTFCGSCNPLLGTTMKIINGTPPYSYKWTTKLNLFGNSYFYGKSFLNDTTLSTPLIKEAISNMEWNPFYVEVTDANKQIARDTILIRFSSFIATTMEIYYFQKEGDEIELSDVGVSGGILPYKSYQWSPTTGLSNPDSLVTRCKVTGPMTYTLTITDSVGCQTSGSLKIFLTGLNQLKKNISPVQKGNSIVWSNDNRLPVHLIFYRMNGDKIKEVQLESSNYTMQSKLADKVLLFQLRVGERIYTGKFINR